MKLQRRFAPTGGEFAPELVARFIGIRRNGAFLCISLNFNFCAGIHLLSYYYVKNLYKTLEQSI